jgi:hypothetical protein
MAPPNGPLVVPPNISAKFPSKTQPVRLSEVVLMAPESGDADVAAPVRVKFASKVLFWMVTPPELKTAPPRGVPPLPVEVVVAQFPVKIQSVADSWRQKTAPPFGVAAFPLEDCGGRPFLDT